jgi:hypothetical protein
MKYLKTFENLTTERDFDKVVYSPEDKSIIGAYMITSGGSSIGILNIKEKMGKGIFMSNHFSYDISIHRTHLDRSKIEILEDVPGKEGFNYIKIPYSLYKENKDNLEIARIKGSKRISMPAIKTQNNYFMSNFRDIDVVNYIKVTNPDKRTHFLVDMYHNKK